MPDNDDSSPKELQPGELTKILLEAVLKDDSLRKSLGRLPVWAFLFTGVAASIKLIAGLSFIPWSATSLVGAMTAVLLITVESWLRSKRPSTIFYLCPEEQKFIPIRRSSHPKYRKMKSCSCGCKLIKKCQQRKHEILSTDPDNPDSFPKVDECCQYCDPALPKSRRMYLPETAGKPDSEPSQ